MWKEETSEDFNLWSCFGLWFPQLAFLKNASVFVFLLVTALFPTKAGYKCDHDPQGQVMDGFSEKLPDPLLPSSPLMLPRSDSQATVCKHYPSSHLWWKRWEPPLSLTLPWQGGQVLKDSALHTTTPPSPSSTPHLTRLPSRLPELGLPKGGFSGPPPPTAAPACPFPVPLTSNSVFSTSNCSDSQLLLDFYNHLPPGLLTFCTPSSF